VAKKQPVAVAGLLRAIAMLRDGVSSRDWTQVDEAYVLLSGEPAPGPSAQTVQSRQFLATLADAISQHLNGMSVEVPVSVPPSPMPAPHLSASPVPAGVPVLGIAANDPEIMPPDPADAIPRPKTRRGDFRLLELTCARCEKKDQVHPSLRPIRLDKDDEEPRYICNDCAARGPRHE
jgi:hypothetical protein